MNSIAFIHVDWRSRIGSIRKKQRAIRLYNIEAIWGQSIVQEVVKIPVIVNIGCIAFPRGEQHSGSKKQKGSHGLVDLMNVIFFHSHNILFGSHHRPLYRTIVLYSTVVCENCIQLFTALQRRQRSSHSE